MKRKSNLRLVTDATVRDGGGYNKKPRNVVIEMSPSCGDVLTVRLLGLRSRLHVPVENIYWYAKRQEADALAREKRETRKSKRGPR